MDIRANSIVGETQPDLLESICCQRIKNLYCLKKKKKKKNKENTYTRVSTIYIYIFFSTTAKSVFVSILHWSMYSPPVFFFFLSIFFSFHSANVPFFCMSPCVFSFLVFCFRSSIRSCDLWADVERAKNGRRSTNPSPLAVILTVIRCFVGDRLDDDNDNNDNDDHHQHHHQHHHHHHHHSPLVAHSRKYARRRDMLYNSFTGKFHCPNCNNGYGRRDTMLGHFRYECGKAPRYKCPYCTLCSKKTSNVYQHIRSMHPKELVTLVKLYWSVESMELFLTLRVPPPPSLSPFLSPFRRCRIPILMQIVRSIDRTYKRRTIVHSPKIVVSNE